MPKLKYNANTKVHTYVFDHLLNFLTIFVFLMQHINDCIKWKVFKILKTSLEACFFLARVLPFYYYCEQNNREHVHV